MRLILLISIIVVAGIVGYFVVNRQPPSKTTTPATTGTTTPSKAPLKCFAINVVSPKPNTKISSPLKLEVIVDKSNGCKWTVFEAQAGSVTIKDSNGNELGQGVLKTTQDWMASTPVTYTADIIVKSSTTASGTISISEENPSGATNSLTLTYPVTF